MRLSIQEIARAIGAPYQGEETVWIDHITTDSRQLEGNCLFVAIVGERVDGHDYIQKALAGGAAFAVAHRPVEGDQSRILYVKDTLPVLMDIARYYRRRFALVTVGITGSVGKTTTKELTAAVVGQRYKTLKSQGNKNNEFGLPNTVFQLDESYQAAVLEMGMDGMGDISKLTSIVLPNVGVITNVGVSHLERLGSRENICKAKLEIKEGMADGSILLLNGDNDLLREQQDSRLKLRFFGIENERCDYRAKEIAEGPDGVRFVVCHGQECTPVHLPTIGRHNVYNALAAFGVGDALGMSGEEIAAALAGYTPTGMRQKMVQHAGYTVVEDCYNASPDSMHAALDALAGYPVAGKKYCVFADMLELGEISEQAHREVGALAAEKGVDALFTYGPQSWYYVQGAEEAGLPATHCETHEEVAAALLAQLRPGDLVWVKGSRGMALEKVLELLYKG